MERLRDPAQLSASGTNPAGRLVVEVNEVVFACQGHLEIRFQESGNSGVGKQEFRSQAS
jgi:hypothetical protein